MNAVIQTEGLSKQFGKSWAVKDFTLEVKPGSVCGFFGRNGAGKTTTIKMLAGLYRPTFGSARVLGQDPWSMDIPTKQRIGYLSEKQVLPLWLNIGELMHFCKQLYPQWDDGYATSLLTRFKLTEDKKIRQLSMGTQRHVGLLLALAQRPDLLILDEPAGGLDTVVRREFLETVIDLLQGEGKTVFLSSHILTDAERIVDDVVIIHEGHLLVHRSLDELKESVKRIRVVFESEAPMDFPVPGLIRAHRNGREWLLTIDKPNLPALTQRVVIQRGRIEVLGMSLEDLFMDFVA